MSILSFRTQGFNPYAVAYSPFFDSKIAVASAANFGLVGNGRLYVLDITPSGEIVAQYVFDTQDGLFDLAWSEVHENQIVTSSGDGTIKLYDLMAANPASSPSSNRPSSNSNINFPIQLYREHTREVFSVNWNLVQKSLFCSASWDGTIKIWTPESTRSVATLVAPLPDHSATTAQQPKIVGSGAPINKAHAHAPGSTPGGGQQGPVGTSGCIHTAKFSPHDANLIASAHADSHIRVWDTRVAIGRHGPSLDFFGHAGVEALTLDWNKYRPTVLATGGVDRAIKIWDIRMIPPATTSSLQNNNIIKQQQKTIVSPINELLGHDYAVRNLAWSPHSGDVLMSTSYDMTARIWRDVTAQGGDSNNVAAVGSRYLSRLNHGSGLLNVFSNHTEFVMGCDWSLWGEPGWVSSVGWDEMLYIWKGT